LAGGEVTLEDPDPNAVNVFLFYDHPSISDRVHFFLTYDPWSKAGRGIRQMTAKR
jgi:hypothetical protein